MNPFIYEICNYLATVGSPTFIFTDASNANLKIGELARGVDGIFAVEVPSVPPDMYTAIEYHQIDFWAANVSRAVAYEQLQKIYIIFHRLHHYQTTNYEIYYSYAPSNIQDLDVNGESRKILKVSIVYIIRNLNLIS